MESNSIMQDIDSASDADDVHEINCKIKRDNERLIEEVQTLKSQLNQTLEFQAQNEELCKQVTKLQAELRSSKATIDDLSSRLAINLKMNEELKNKIEKSKQPPKLDAPTRAEILDQERKKFAKQIAKFNSEISSKEDLVKRSLEENEELRNQINKILKASQEKFNTVFKDSNSLITYINTIPDNVTPEQTVLVPEAPPLFDERLVRKIEKLKKEIKNEQKERAKAEEQVKCLSKQLKEVQDVTNDRIAAVNEELSDAKHKASMESIESSHEIDKLKTEKMSLTQTNEKLKKRLDEAEKELANNKNPQIAQDALTENASLKKEIEHLSAILKDRDQSIYAIRSQVESLQSQNSSADIQQENLKKKIAKGQEEIASLNAEKNSLACENHALLLQKTGLEEQIRTMNVKASTTNAALQQTQTLLEESKAENDKISKATSNLDEIINAQKKEIQDVYSQRNRLVTIVQRQSNLLVSMESKLDSAQNEIKTVKKNLKLTQEKLNEELEKPPAQVDIPVTSWFNKDFPRELCSVITDYAKNEALEPTSKLRNVLQSIATYYNKVLNEEKKNSETFTKQTKEREERNDNFLAELGALFGLEHLSTDAVVSECGVTKNIIKNIRTLQEEQAEAINEKTRVQNDLSNIVSKLEVKNVEEAETMIAQLYQKINSLENELQNEHSNLSKAKKVIKSQEQKIKAQSSEYESSVKKLKSVIADKEVRNKKTNEALQNSELRVSELQRKVDDQSEQFNDELESIRQQHNAEIKKISDNSDMKQKEISSELTKKVAEIGNLKQKVSDKQREIEQLSKTISTFEEIKRQKDAQIQAVIDQYEESEREIRENAQKEKETLKQQYDKCITNMKKENIKLSESHEESNAALVEADKRVNDLTQKLVASGLQIDDLKNRVAMVSEESERQIRITEMKTRSALLSQEMHYQGVIEESKSEFLTEKRKVIGFVAQQFRQYFDARMELDDNCLKYVVKAVRGELDRLSKQEASLKRIVGTSSNEALEDAVSRIVLNVCHK